MLAFHEQVISDLLEDDNGGLVVLGSGLSLHKLAAALITLHSSSSGCLFILSASDSQRAAISLQLPPPSPLLISSTQFLALDRKNIYSHGGSFFITPRILIVDILNSNISMSSISGIILLNVHSLSETCTEAFIIRLFRTANPKGFVRALTDRPQAMVSGFSKAERIMKSCLFVRKLHIWPRFHVLVSQDLEGSNPFPVIDIRTPLSKAMKGIQDAVLEVMEACLQELRKTNKVDVEDLTVESGLFKSFDEIVRRQLDPIWHMVGRKTRQLVSDLKTVRKLADYLVRYDSVSFLKYLNTLRVSEGVRSVWIFAKPAHKIFELAKRRVYRVLPAGGDTGVSAGSAGKKRKAKEGESNDANEAKDSHSSMVLEVVLEEPPKWKVLREVLEEVEEERQKQVLNEDTWDDESNTVLVACKDELSCMQLQDCISKGPQQVMREEWERYLLGKADLHGLKTRNKKKSQEPKGFGVLNGVIPARPGENAEASSISNLEQSALLAAAAEVKNVGEEEAVTREPQLHGGRGNRGRGRGRGRGSGGKTSGSKARLPKSKDKGKQEKGNSTLMSESGNEDRAAGEGPVAMASSFTKMGGGASVENGNIGTKPLPVVQFFAMDSDQKILDVFKPSVIIVYHPDMTFVREIEVYKAENPTRNLKVYFLFYEESTEVQKFEASIRRENGAFESLIRQKSLMMIPVDQDGRVVPNTPGEPQSLISQNALTRKAGGRKAIEKETQVIVDVREFMSSLPNVLHQKGMKIIPVTLEVGDYILSPLICVERKSIADLYSSFASGRLYNQVETMVRYYRIPVVLIEFSQDKSFSFQSASEIGDDVSPNSIISKLCLLVLHFPRLRLVWSRSLHATAEIFASLKANQDEPDESTAMRVGVPSEEGIVENDVRAENYNTSAVEFLRRLPGVTDSNYRSIMDGCNSLAELAVLPLEKLAELMGGQRAARMLRDFLDAKCPNF